MQTTIGILNNILVCAFLTVISLVLSFRGSGLLVKDHNKSLMRYYRLHLVFFACVWFFQSVLLFSAHENYPRIVMFALFAIIVSVFAQCFFLLAYYFGVYVKNKFVFVGFLSALFLLILFGLTQGIPVFESSVWGYHLQYNDLFLRILGYGMYIPILILSLFSFFYNLLKKNSGVGTFGFIAFTFLYELLLFFEISGFFTGIGLMFIRISILTSFLFVFLMLLRKNLPVSISEGEFKLKSPLIIKSIFYSLFTTLIPLTLAAFLLSYSLSFTHIGNYFDKSFDENTITSVKNLILMTAFVVGIISFFVSLLVIRFLDNRIRSLIRAVDAVLQADFTYRIKDAHPYDELGSLSLSFNDMANDLSRYDKEIVDYEHLLEEKVNDRTHALEAKTRETQELLSTIKKNSEQLQQNTSTIIDQMEDVLLVLDDENRIVRFNKAFLKIFKIDSDVIIGSFLTGIASFGDFSDMIMRMREEKLTVYQQKIQLIPPLSGLLECRLTRFELSSNRFGTIILMRDITPPWGVVYESKTNEVVPMVVVRLYNEANNKIIAEETTDEFGRFIFYVTPGSYYLRLFKDGYHFPSLVGDGYHGEVINIIDRKEAIIDFDILIDRL